MDDLLKKAKSQAAAVVSVAACADAHVLEACAAAHEQGIADFILVGDESKTREIAAQEGIDLSGFTLMHQADNTTACE